MIAGALHRRGQVRNIQVNAFPTVVLFLTVKCSLPEPGQKDRRTGELTSMLMACKPHGGSYRVIL